MKMAKTVFITKGSETWNKKPKVSFGSNANQINRSGKSFSKMESARKFANVKAKKMGLKNYEILVSGGIKKVKVR